MEPRHLLAQLRKRLADLARDGESGESGESSESEDETSTEDD
ncbi:MULTISPECIES: hypothetical protein [Aeromicrobium]|nr:MULTISPECIES: hypothetical protein [Aeromicrobium]